MATGFPVKANYATGDVLTAANMNDLSGTVNYLQYMPPRNPIINSNFSVWQRGTSVALAASTGVSSSSYTADRWQTATGANQAITVSRQATGDTTNLPNIQYCLRYQRNSGQTGTGQLNFAQSFESVNSIPFAGKTVTLSFYARAGANYSAASSALPVALYSGTGTDQNVISGVYTGAVAVISQTATLTTTWQRFTYTGTVGATATELGLYFAFTPTGTASTNDYYEITGVQLELGSVANTYMPNQPTYQGELAACQRYYWKHNASGGVNQGIVGGGFYTATSVLGIVRFPVSMRTTPTLSVTSGTGYYQSVRGGGVNNLSSFAQDSANTDTSQIYNNTEASGTIGYYANLISNNASSSIAWSAEL